MFFSDYCFWDGLAVCQVSASSTIRGQIQDSCLSSIKYELPMSSVVNFMNGSHKAKKLNVQFVELSGSQNHEKHLNLFMCLWKTFFLSRYSPVSNLDSYRKHDQEPFQLCCIDSNKYCNDFSQYRPVEDSCSNQAPQPCSCRWNFGFRRRRRWTRVVRRRWWRRAPRRGENRTLF